MMGKIKVAYVGNVVIKKSGRTSEAEIRLEYGPLGGYIDYNKYFNHCYYLYINGSSTIVKLYNYVMIGNPIKLKVESIKKFRFKKVI